MRARAAAEAASLLLVLVVVIVACHRRRVLDVSPPTNDTSPWMGRRLPPSMSSSDHRSHRRDYDRLRRRRSLSLTDATEAGRHLPRTRRTLELDSAHDGIAGISVADATHSVDTRHER